MCWPCSRDPCTHACQQKHEFPSSWQDEAGIPKIHSKSFSHPAVARDQLLEAAPVRSNRWLISQFSSDLTQENTNSNEENTSQSTNKKMKENFRTTGLKNSKPSVISLACKCHLRSQETSLSLRNHSIDYNSHASSLPNIYSQVSNAPQLHLTSTSSTWDTALI